MKRENSQRLFSFCEMGLKRVFPCLVTEKCQGGSHSVYPVSDGFRHMLMLHNPSADHWGSLPFEWGFYVDLYLSFRGCPTHSEVSTLPPLRACKGNG
jgi:hypothetical protein